MEKRQLLQQVRSVDGMKQFPWLLLLLATFAVARTSGLTHPTSSLSSSSSSSYPIPWRGGAFGRSNSNINNSEDDHHTKPSVAATAAVDIVNDETTSTSEKEQNTNHNATVQEYVAAMKERDGKDQLLLGTPKEKNKDEEDDEGESDGPSSNGASFSDADAAVDNNDQDEPSPPESGLDGGSVDEDSSVVGVKAHTHKKSNAVGDPDGDDDDDDDDHEEDSLSEFSEEWEELEEFENEYQNDIGTEDVDVKLTFDFFYI